MKYTKETKEIRYVLKTRSPEEQAIVKRFARYLENSKGEMSTFPERKVLFLAFSRVLSPAPLT